MGTASLIPLGRRCHAVWDHGRHCQMYLLTQYVVPDFRWWMEVSAASSRTLPPSTVPYTTQWSPACMVQRRARTGRSGSII